MTIITRRSALGGLALLPATAGAGAAACTLAAPEPHPDTLAAQRAADSPEARVRHHLLYAGMACEEFSDVAPDAYACLLMVSPERGREMLVVSGRRTVWRWEA